MGPFEVQKETHLEVTKVDFGRAGNHVCLIHPPEGNAIDLVGPSDQQQSARQLLQEHDALPPEATREEDENGAGCDGGAEVGRLGGFPALLGLTDIFRGVEARRLLGGDDTARAILVAADGGLLRRRDLSRGGLRGLFLAFVQGAAREDGRAGEAADAGDEFLAAGHLRVRERKLSAGGTGR